MQQYVYDSQNIDRIIRDEKEGEKVVIQRAIPYAIGIKRIEWTNKRKLVECANVVGNEIVPRPVTPAKCEGVVVEAYSGNDAYSEDGREKEGGRSNF